jgi:hypothetical protein
MRELDRYAWILRASAAALGLALLGCASALGEPAPNRVDSYAGKPTSVLDAAADLLRRQGYVVQQLDATFLELQGERVEVASRTDGSLARGTIVTQQVVVDADDEGERTRVSALFTINHRRPTGERRSWSPESSLSQRLRDRFYADLHREIGDSSVGSAAPAAP